MQEVLQEKAVSPRLANWNSIRVLFRAFGYLRRYWRVVAGAYAAVLVITGLNVFIPQLIRGIIDRGLTGGDLGYARWAALLLLGLAAVKAVFTFWQQRWLEVASQNVAYDMRNDVQARLTDLSFAFQDKSEAGQLLSRTIQDVERIRFLTGRAVWRVVDGLVLLVATAGVLIWMNPRLAALVLLTLPLLIWRAIDYSSKSRPLSVRIQDEL